MQEETSNQVSLETIKNEPSADLEVISEVNSEATDTVQVHGGISSDFEMDKDSDAQTILDLEFRREVAGDRSFTTDTETEIRINFAEQEILPHDTSSLSLQKIVQEVSAAEEENKNPNASREDPPILPHEVQPVEVTPEPSEPLRFGEKLQFAEDREPKKPAKQHKKEAQPLKKKKKK